MAMRSVSRSIITASGSLKAAAAVQASHLGGCSLLSVQQKAGSNHTCPADTTPAQQLFGCMQSPQYHTHIHGVDSACSCIVKHAGLHISVG